MNGSSSLTRVVVVMAAAMGVTAVVWASSSGAPKSAHAPGAGSSSPRFARGSIESAFSREKGPFFAGEKVSLGEAEDSAKLIDKDFLFFRPNHPLANDDSIRSVFMETANDETGTARFQIAIDYESGILMYLWPDEGTDDLQKHYEALAAEFGAGAEVTSINGAPALIVDGSDTRPSAASTVLSGIKIQLIAKNAQIDASTIPAIAQSLS